MITKKKLIGLVLVKLKYTVETSVPLTKKFKWMYVYFWPSDYKRFHLIHIFFCYVLLFYF